ncbi:MAG: pyridoxal phosphate-dependent aminotransferase, partial [Conexibacter sp.]
RRDGGDFRILMLTLPDNPTGTVASEDEVRAVCEVAERHGLTIVSDEIYRDLAHDPAALRSPAELLPQRTFVTTGLSKSMALGGWRIGFVRLPDGDLGREVAAPLLGLASEVWSCVAAPIEAAAVHVLEEPDEVVAHVEAARRLHRCVTTAAHAHVVAAGARCRAPQGGFYLYPDLEPARDALQARGVEDGDALAELLLERFGIGVLPGSCFGDEPTALRFRMATSLLYGETDEQRWTALASEAPAELPWIRAALDALHDALVALGRA